MKSEKKFHSGAFQKIPEKELGRIRGGLAILPFLAGFELGERIADKVREIFTPPVED